MSIALAYFKALADETRLRLLHVLAHYELSVNELVSILQMGQSRISRHLKILTEANLLQWRRDGLWVFYTVTKEGDAQNFIKSMLPFVDANPLMQNDVHLGARCIEERALRTRQFFNAIAEDWDTLTEEILGSFDLAQAVCATLPKPCELAVDLGCGTGSVLEKILPHVTSVVGVDGSPRMLELARRRFAPESTHMGNGMNPEGQEGRVSLRIGELDYLPLRDGEADFACINLVLHHLSNPLCTLKEVHRILRQGGTVFIADFDKHTNEKMRENFGDRWLGFDHDTMTQFIHEAGLSLVSIQRTAVQKNLDLLLVVAKKDS